MFNWLRELYTVKREGKLCDSCETLRSQLAFANEREKQLLNRLLEKPAVEPMRVPVEVTQSNKAIPWKVRQEMLEKEDRVKARLLREAPKPDTVISTVTTTENLEEELGVKDAVGQSDV